MNIDQHVKLSESAYELAYELRPHENLRFDYCRIYDNGNFFHLGTKPGFLYHYIARKLYEINNVEHQARIIEDGFYLSYLLPKQNIYKILELEFSEFHGFYFIKKHKKYTDTFYFYTEHQYPEILNFYFNNAVRMEYMCQKFLTQTELMITEAEKNCVQLTPDRPKETSNISTNKFFLGKQFDNRFLSKTEINIIKYLIFESSSKNIAKNTGHSIRTIENHLLNIRNKLGCNHKSQIIRTLKTNNFLKYIVPDFWGFPF